MRWEGPSEAAGARAGRVLPACFALLEGCIEALAADTQVGAAANNGQEQPLLPDPFSRPLAAAPGVRRCQPISPPAHASRPPRSALRRRWMRRVLAAPLLPTRRAQCCRERSRSAPSSHCRRQWRWSCSLSSRPPARRRRSKQRQRRQGVPWAGRRPCAARCCWQRCGPWPGAPALQWAAHAQQGQWQAVHACCSVCCLP